MGGQFTRVQQDCSFYPAFLIQELSELLFPLFIRTYLHLVSDRKIDQAKQFFNDIGTQHSFFTLSDDEIARFRALTHEQLSTAPYDKRDDLIYKWIKYKYRVRMGAPVRELLEQKLSAMEPAFREVVNETVSIKMTKQTTTQLGRSQRGWGRLSVELPTVDEDSRDTVHPTLKDDHRWVSNPEHFVTCAEKMEEVLTEEAEEEEEEDDTKALQPPRRRHEFRAPDMPRVRMPMAVQERILAMVNHADHVSANSLPSICQFTALNVGPTSSMTISRFGDLAMVGSRRGVISVWDLNHPRDAAPSANRYTLVGHSSMVTSLSLSADNALLLSSDAEGAVRMWLAGSSGFRGQVARREGCKCPVWSVSWSPYGLYYVTGSHNGTATLWNCERAAPCMHFTGHLSDVNDATIHTSGDIVVTAGADATARMFDTRVGSNSCHLYTLSPHTEAAVKVRASPDGRVLATADMNGLVMIWDTRMGRLLATLNGHTAAVKDLDFSRSGTLLSTVAVDGVRLWDMTTLRSLARVPCTASFPQYEPEDEETAPALPFSTNSVPELHLSVYPTKQPLLATRFTYSDVLIAGGVFTGQTE
ncbi:WD40 associated region in TFIID subunit [Carpediemonas membranifera]|uniref:WD40 associated region in TFIID subunit n=1 Tax=Carpediemonas membranifera TaxID=201153 RepID=A0A8J6AR37_9EUKA|nr:WD40 associated region in TFIID subunit [Carpediemonas membranifera]|eukprot:KAG9390005.1 WD40 associated region in TFIID subunit [Carpediemonas membranifera]